MGIWGEFTEVLNFWAMKHPLIWFVFGILVIVFPFLYAPWLVSREHKISYWTALMNLRIWLFRDRTEARLLRLAHRRKEDNK